MNQRQITFHLPIKTMETVKKIADSLDISQALIIREGIDQVLQALRPGPTYDPMVNVLLARARAEKEAMIERTKRTEGRRMVEDALAGAKK